MARHPSSFGSNAHSPARVGGRLVASMGSRIGRSTGVDSARWRCRGLSGRQLQAARTRCTLAAELTARDASVVAPRSERVLTAWTDRTYVRRMTRVSALPESRLASLYEAEGFGGER